MKALHRPLIITIISLSLSISHAVATEKDQLSSFIASYRVSTMGLEGIDVTRTLKINTRPQGYQYHFQSYSIPIGLLALKKNEIRDEQSEGHIINGIVQPSHYRYKQIRNGKIRRNIQLDFDWSKKSILMHHKHSQKQWKIALPKNTVDKLSYQLSLIFILNNLATNNKANKHFKLSIADHRKLKQYNFTLLGKEKMTTPLGTFQTLKVKYQRHKTDKTITLWCATSLNFLPIKIIQDEKDKPQFISTLITYKKF